ARKHRSYVQDDLGSGGPMCRIRQKANRCSQGSSLSKHKSKFDSSAQRFPLKRSQRKNLHHPFSAKLTSNLALGSLDKVDLSKFLLSSQNNQNSEGQHRMEENGPQRFAVPLIVLISMNRNSTAARVQGNAPTTNAPSTLALPAEPPQKKPAFQISAPEDFDVSDDDNHSTTPPVQGNAPTTNAASTLALRAEPPQ
ncbi:hypothetical protein Tco_1565698, partial [Tanacetum coccineum]